MRQPATDLARHPARDPRAGSALIVAVVFSTIIMFGLAGLLPMLVNDWKASAQTSTQEAAFALAESGVDEAIWAVLEHADDDAAWTGNGWTDGGNYWHREWTLAAISSELAENFELDEGRTGLYRVLVQKLNSGIINIVSQGVVSGGKNVRSGEIARIIETEFRRPNPLGYGLIARDGLDFNGRPTFDRYDSRIFPYIYSNGVNSITEREYQAKLDAAASATERDAIERDYAFYVGSISNFIAKLGIGNSIIDGKLATGASDDGSDPTGGATVEGGVEWDFQMEFPPVQKPDTADWDNSI